MDATGANIGNDSAIHDMLLHHTWNMQHNEVQSRRSDRGTLLRLQKITGAWNRDEQGDCFGSVPNKYHTASNNDISRNAAYYC